MPTFDGMNLLFILHYTLMSVSIILWCPTRCICTMHYVCISIISHGRPTFPNAVLQRFVTRSYGYRAAAIAKRLK